MKQKKYLFITSIVLALFVLVACGKQPTGTVSLFPSSTGLPDPTSGAGTATPTATPDISPTETPKEAFLKLLRATDLQNLYECPAGLVEFAGLEGMDYTSYELTDGLVVYTSTEFLGEEDRFSLISYDPDTLKKQNEIKDHTLFTNSSFFCLGNRYVTIYEIDKKTFHIYNGKLDEVAVFNVPGDESYKECTLDANGENFILLSQSGSVYKAALGSGENTLNKLFSLEAPYDTGAVYIASLPGDIYAFSCGYMSDETHWADKIVYVNGEDGSILKVEEGSFITMHVSPSKDEYIKVQTQPEYVIKLYKADGTLVHSVPLATIQEYTYLTVDWNNRRLLTLDYSYSIGTSIRQYKCYSLDTGKMLSNCLITSAVGSVSAFTPDVEKSLVPFVINSRDENGNLIKYCFWDYSGGNIAETEDYYKKRTAVYDPVSDKIDALRNRMEKEYGLYIYIGYEIFGDDLAGSNAVALRDEKRLFNILTAFDEALAQYPEGFFLQFREVCAKRIGLYITEDVPEMRSYYRVNGYESVIVIDADDSENPEKTLYHEISHLIDDYISRTGSNIAFEEGYAGLNPLPTKEYYLYSSDEDYIEKGKAYTLYNERDNGNVYSVYQYGRTFPGEDRATLFEQAMAFDLADESLGEYYRDIAKCSHILEKLEYHFNAIRECFDTSRWPRKTAWEEKLDLMKACLNGFEGPTPAPTETATPTPAEITKAPAPSRLSKDQLVATLEQTGQNAVYRFGGFFREHEGVASGYVLDDGLVIIYRSVTEDDPSSVHLVSYNKYDLSVQKDLSDLWPGCTKTVYQYSSAGILVLVETPGAGAYEKVYYAYLYNGRLEEVASYLLQGVEYPTGLVYSEKTGLILYVNGSDSVYAYDTKSGKVETVCSFYDTPGYIYNIKPCGVDTIICDIDNYNAEGVTRNSYKIDVVKREICEHLDNSSVSAIENTDGRSVRSVLNPLGFIFSDVSGNTLDISAVDEDEVEFFVADWDHSVLITTNNLSYSDEPLVEFRCYSMKTGELRSDCVIRAASYVYGQCALDTENSLVYFIGAGTDVNGQKGVVVYAWDYLNDGVEEKSSIYTKQTHVTHRFSEEVEALRKKIEDRYNVYLYLGYEAVDPDISDYTIWPCVEELDILLALKNIEEVLEDYPDGFFGQIKNASKKTLGLYINSGISGNGENTVSIASGLACGIGYERALMLDISNMGILSGTLYHEIAHWIDQTIEELERQGRYGGFEEGFAALNPTDDYYLYSYADYYGRNEYTYLGSSLDMVYSIDAYGRTYPTEDRARMVEYLMVDDHGWPLYLCPHLMEKYRYYFSVIRETFDTTGWPEKTAWELKLSAWEQKQ